VVPKKDENRLTLTKLVARDRLTRHPINMPVRFLLPPLVWATSLTLACANVAPTAVIQSAVMRPGTTLMDVVYRVNDSDDATVKVRALAFVDGERSFANVLKPVTFVEGTAAKLGDAILSNTNHTLTWDVAADWNVGLGQVKFEILCRDARGLLAIDWITIPAAGGNPALTISKDTPSDASMLNALLWQYADGDPGLTLEDGKLRGNSTSGNFAGINLATGSTLDAYAATFLYKRMNLDPALSSEVTCASVPARAGLLNTGGWHATNRNYDGLPLVVAWGNTNMTPPVGLSGISAISAGRSHSLALMNDGTVVIWGGFLNPPVNAIPEGLSGVTAISAGSDFSLALKNDGTVVAWGENMHGQTTIPADLTGVTAIAAGNFHSLALKSDGTVVSWGGSDMWVPPVPAGLAGVTAVAASQGGSLALKNDGTVVGWGGYAVPAGLSGVTAIAAGPDHFLACKTDGTVVAWGENWGGQLNIPAGLSGVTAIGAGAGFSVALKSDGTVVDWGYNPSGQITVPVGLSGVTAISVGYSHVLALKPEVP
jgi:hypothetical protein